MEKMKDLWIVFCVAAAPWVLGFWLQRINNVARLQDYSIEGKRVWTLLLGVRSRKGERVYLRPAWLQSVALLYLVVGSLVVWFCDIKTLRNVTVGILITGLCGGALVWHIIGYMAGDRSKQ